MAPSRCLACSKLMRRQRRHVRVGDHLQQHRAVGGEGLGPGGVDVLRAIHADALEAEHVRITRVGEIDHFLRRAELRVAGQGTLLPGHLVEIAVVQHQHDEGRRVPALPVLLHGDQFGVAVHLHGAVADHRHHRPLRIGELGGDGVGHAAAHGRQLARQRAEHARAHADVAGVPVGMRAAVAAENRIVRQLLRQGTEYPLRVDRVGWLFGLAPGFLATGRHRPLDPAAPGTVLFLLEQRQQALQGFPASPSKAWSIG